MQGLSYGISIKGTHAHSFVSSFVGFKDLKTTTMKDAHGVEREFAAVAQKYRAECGVPTNEGELAAFVSYAMAYPSGFLALVDTYDTVNSGVPNFLSVALALHEVRGTQSSAVLEGRHKNQRRMGAGGGSGGG